MAFFIACQYYFSLTYYRYTDEKTKENLEFYNMIEFDKLHKWTKEDPIYFRFKPYKYDWIILIMTTGLVSINKIFEDQKKANALQVKIFNDLESVLVLLHRVVRVEAALAQIVVTQHDGTLVWRTDGVLQ